MCRAFLFFFLACVLSPWLAGSQGRQVDFEREALRAAGFPLIVSGLDLDGAGRAQILSQISNLRTCCDASLVLVLQDRPLNGSAQQDLSVLVDQMRRTDQWSDGSLVILIQQNPAEALAARAPDLSARTAFLQKRRLDQLTLSLREEGALVTSLQLLADLQARLRLGPVPELAQRLWTIPPPMIEALFHGATLWALGLLGLLSVRLAPWRRQDAALSLVLEAKTGPQRLAWQGLETRALVSRLSLWHLRHPGLPRHRLWLFGLAWAYAWPCFFLLEPAFFGTILAWEDWQLYLFQDSWAARASLNLSLTFLLFLIFLNTPLGYLLTPRRWHQARTAHRLSRRLSGQDPRDLKGAVLVWQRRRRRLQVWLPKGAPVQQVSLKAALKHLQQDAEYGDLGQAVAEFTSRFDRLARRYGEGGGKVLIGQL